MLDGDNSIMVVGNNGAKVTIDLRKLLDDPTEACGQNGLSVEQIESKSAIATVVKTDNGLTAITSDGLQSIVVE